ncbi:MAG: LytTR family DNA-binding domain-containing protein, partial [Lachnospiraceae bacterium]|nr:LytTR family DNA-binding domain-containing protein [Lachnospiraceae bacterium]
MYFESKKRVIYIHMADGTVHKFYDKLNEIEEQLKSEKVDFWRIHQSYLVNSRYIIRMSYDQVELSDKKQLFISEERRKMISEKYCDSVGDKIIE